uniref:Uncharacterized protein n=1 Tax=Glossina brevipalpis TaxID=37001 RepID=A0A1A9X3F7_9MUSC
MSSRILENLSLLRTSSQAVIPTAIFDLISRISSSKANLKCKLRRRDSAESIGVSIGGGSGPPMPVGIGGGGGGGPPMPVGIGGGGGGGPPMPVGIGGGSGAVSQLIVGIGGGGGAVVPLFVGICGIDLSIFAILMERNAYEKRQFIREFCRLVALLQCRLPEAIMNLKHLFEANDKRHFTPELILLYILRIIS